MSTTISPFEQSSGYLGQWFNICFGVIDLWLAVQMMVLNVVVIAVRSVPIPFAFPLEFDSEWSLDLSFMDYIEIEHRDDADSDGTHRHQQSG